MNEATLNSLHETAIGLLQKLIAIPSLSKEEDKTADCIMQFILQNNIQAKRYLNNVWAANKYFNPSKPTILLNSHHDTVKPSPSYTLNPHGPIIKEGKLFGLGSNDAGGPLVCLIATFLHFYEVENQPYNLIIAATAEEEISGKNGIEALLNNDGFQSIFADKNYTKPIGAIVGEPTLLQMAVAERGLLVLDCVAHGKAGHAARNEGDNAIYKALKDIAWMGNSPFKKVSGLLGAVSINVTSIETKNKAHNVVPDECTYVADVRVNELYSLEGTVDFIQQNVSSTVTPRSIRLRSSIIANDHPLVIAGNKLSLSSYGSPTLSDKALMPFPALKIGPGDSARSHTADEYINVEELKKGIETYISIIQNLS